MTRSLAVLMLFAGTVAFAADPPTSVDSKALDKTIIATLRDIHDRGADLYNQSKDYSATYRLYEGSLLTVKPLLGHRPDVQKTIETGLATANKDADPARKAFLLHEAIEKVRAELKGVPAVPKTVDPAPKPIDPKPKDPVPMPMPKPVDPKPKEAAPMPKPKAESPVVSGKVTVQGKPLVEGSVTLVSLDQKKPKVVTATVKDGSYTLKDLPAGKYAVAVTSEKAGTVPLKFATTDTSGLTFQSQAGANQFDIDLK